MERFNTSKMTIAPGVVDRIISISAANVDGVSSVSSYVSGGLLRQLASRAKREAISTEVDENGRLNISIHLNAFYGYSIPELANNVRESVADALLLQTGIEVNRIDIEVESVQFKKQD